MYRQCQQRVKEYKYLYPHYLHQVKFGIKKGGVKHDFYMDATAHYFEFWTIWMSSAFEQSLDIIEKELCPGKSVLDMCHHHQVFT